jgi:hypothetical protein
MLKELRVVIHLKQRSRECTMTQGEQTEENRYSSKISERIGFRVAISPAHSR